MYGFWRVSVLHSLSMKLMGLTICYNRVATPFYIHLTWKVTTLLTLISTFGCWVMKVQLAVLDLAWFMDPSRTGAAMYQL